MFGAIAKFGSKLIRPIVSNPAVKAVVKSIPGGAAAYAAGNLITGTLSGAPSGLPALPNLAGGPVMPGGLVPGMGDRGWFQNDPNIPDFLKPFAISKANLKAYYRGPKGTVIVYDSVGDPYALDRRLAVRFKLWKPGPKPPISVGTWQAIKKADRGVKKMRQVFRVTTRVDKNISGGKVVVAGRKKGGK